MVIAISQNDIHGTKCGSAFAPGAVHF